MCSSDLLSNEKMASAVRKAASDFALLLAQYRVDSIHGLFHLTIANPACCVEYDAGIGGE